MRPSVEVLEIRDVPSGLHHHHGHWEHYGPPPAYSSGVYLACNVHDLVVDSADVLVVYPSGMTSLAEIPVPRTRLNHFTPAVAEAALAQALPSLSGAPWIEQAMAYGITVSLDENQWVTGQQGSGA